MLINIKTILNATIKLTSYKIILSYYYSGFVQLTMEEENNISYLDLSIHTAYHKLQMGIYRKPTQKNTTKQFTAIRT
jgi:hypothetical protein